MASANKGPGGARNAPGPGVNVHSGLYQDVALPHDLQLRAVRAVKRFRAAGRIDELKSIVQRHAVDPTPENLAGHSRVGQLAELANDAHHLLGLPRRVAGDLARQLLAPSRHELLLAKVVEAADAAFGPEVDDLAVASVLASFVRQPMIWARAIRKLPDGKGAPHG